MAVGDGPAPFSNIGRRAKDLLNKGYNYNHKFLLFLQSSTGLGLKATGFSKGQIFVGDISTEYRTRYSTANVQVDTYSNVSTKIFIANVLPSVKVAISFGTDQKSGKVSTKTMIASVLPYANAAISFDIPDHKSGKAKLEIEEVETAENIASLFHKDSRFEVHV